MSLQKLECRFLIGLPGSGKTTYRQRFIAEHSDYVVVSTDDMIENYAKKAGITYSEAWDKIDFHAFDIQARLNFVNAVLDYKPVIIDRTNMTRKSRNKFASLLTDDYSKIAVVFAPDEAILDQRLKLRETEGKIIPASVMQFLRTQFNPPADDEFETILYIR